MVFAVIFMRLLPFLLPVLCGLRSLLALSLAVGAGWAMHAQGYPVLASGVMIALTALASRLALVRLGQAVLTQWPLISWLLPKPTPPQRGLLGVAQPPATPSSAHNEASLKAQLAVAEATSAQLQAKIDSLELALRKAIQANP
jgi:hypothetical protein